MTESEALGIVADLEAHFRKQDDAKRAAYVHELRALDRDHCVVACQRLWRSKIHFPSLAELLGETRAVGREARAHLLGAVSERLRSIARGQGDLEDETLKPEARENSRWELTAMVPPITLKEWTAARAWREDAHREWTARRARERRDPPPPLPPFRYAQSPPPCFEGNQPSPGHPASVVPRAEAKRRLRAIIEGLVVRSAVQRPREPGQEG